MRRAIFRRGYLTGGFESKAALRTQLERFRFNHWIEKMPIKSSGSEKLSIFFHDGT